MAMVKLFRNRKTGDVTIVPFGRDSVSDRACGPISVIARDVFAVTGHKLIQQNLLEFDERDASIPSDLYQQWDEKTRRLFFSENSACNITWMRRSVTASVYGGANLGFVGTTPFPFVPIVFQTILSRAFDQA